MITVVPGGGYPPAPHRPRAGVNLCELDPEDTSVGYGGLPNADGVIELMPIGDYFSREKLVPAEEILAGVERLGALSLAASGGAV